MCDHTLKHTIVLTTLASCLAELTTKPILDASKLAAVMAEPPHLSELGDETVQLLDLKSLLVAAPVSQECGILGFKLANST